MRTRIDDILLPGAEGGFLSGEILIEDGRILYCGEKQNAPAFSAEENIAGRGRLAMPGLVNAHCHAAMTLLRGIGADRPLASWLFDCVIPMEMRMTPEDVYIGTMLGILEMLRFGVTAFLDMYDPEEAAARAVLKSGIRATLSRGMTGTGENERHKLDESIALYKDFHGAGEGRIRVMLAPHAEYTTSPEFIRMTVKEADRLGCGVHLHLSETASEHSECIERRGKTPAEYFADLGIFDRHAVVAHAVHITESDATLLADKGVYIAHCPVSNLKLGSGVMPLRNTILPRTALGTDGVASNNTLNLFEEMRLFGLLHKGIAQDAARLPAKDALRAATKVGAEALGFSDVGELSPGMQADLILLDMDGPHATPRTRADSHIVYAAQGSDVSLTMVQGCVLYADGKYPGLDAGDIIERAATAAKRIAEGGA